MKRVERELNGKKVILESGRIAKQTSGAVLVTHGDTVVLVTVCAAKKNKPDAPFFPLTCQYLIKYYSTGKIPGGFIKRETRPADNEVLISRIIDRSIRPLFPDNYMAETILTATVLSYDETCPPEFLSMLGASAALHISDIPFIKPIAGLTLGYIDGKHLINPGPKEQENSDLNLFMSVAKDGVLMVESEANELSEKIILDGLKQGYEAMQPFIEMQEELRELLGKPKRKYDMPKIDAGAKKSVTKFAESKLTKALSVKTKIERYEALDELNDEAVEHFADQSETISADEVKTVISDCKKSIMRKSILQKGKRVDGRKNNEIRPITCELGILPRAHGSALFTRGETQALVVTTLGSKEDEQMVDEPFGNSFKRFYLHYNFPGYSVGEAKRPGPPGRREIGHGRLAERALSKVIPNEKYFPYTLRLVSEITESNGSSSMASICGGSLSLMAAGVPIRKPVAGIAMGLISDGKEHAILSDILGDEDHIGDMDFKVAGTEYGIVALQMDIKIEGLSWEIMEKALDQAKDGRMHILGKMNQIMAQPDEEISAYAPRFVQYKVPVNKIRDIIGPGGQVIKNITATANVKINVLDSGMVNIVSNNKENAAKALAIIRELVKDVEIGHIYNGVVKKIMDFGMFVECIPGSDGLVPSAEMQDSQESFTEGQIVKVKAASFDRRGKLRLTIKLD